MGALALVVLPRRRPNGWQALLALGLTVATTVYATEPICHGCREGGPTQPWLAGGVGLGIVLLFVKPYGWRLGVAAGFVLALLQYTTFFVDAVHERGWTGNPAWDGGCALALQMVREQVQTHVAKHPEADVTYPAGWLDELDVGREVAEACAFRCLRVPRRAIRRVWHTPFSGIYAYDLIEQGFWYPGGRVSDVAAQIELRDRPVPADAW